MSGKRLVIMVALGAAIGVGAARAGTPFGGDDSGFVPPDKTTGKCEDTATKNGGKFTSSLIKCHIAVATAAFKSQTTVADDEACEDTARAAVDKANSKLTNPPCPACLVSGLGAGSDTTRSQVDLNGGVVYCAGTTPLTDGDDPGALIPPTKNDLVCETKMAKNASKFISCILKCHIKAADAAVAAKSFDEEGCEETNATHNACGDKYDLAVSVLPSFCPGQCAQVNAAGLKSLILSIVDARNGEAYCQSPSGAFLQ